MYKKVEHRIPHTFLT